LFFVFLQQLTHEGKNIALMPAIRCCINPDCHMLLSHENGCKYVRCQNKRCDYAFCFICLRRYISDTDCCTRDHWAVCELAPPQALVV